MRKSASRPSLSVPVGWMASMLPPPAHRAVILSKSQQGAMFAFNAAPTVGHGSGAMPPASGSFVAMDAAQLLLRLPLSLLAGMATCECGCAMGPFGDHVLSCPSCLCDRTQFRGLVVDAVVVDVARHTSHYNISMFLTPYINSSRRPRAGSLCRPMSDQGPGPSERAGQSQHYFCV